MVRFVSRRGQLVKRACSKQKITSRNHVRCYLKWPDMKYSRGTMREVDNDPRRETPQLRNVAVRGIDIALWDWPGQDPPLLFVHAAGFHGRIWDQVIRAFPDRHSVSIELRGHGRSSKPDPPYRWLDFGMDVAAVANSIDLAGAIGIGHSTGGHALVNAAGERPAAFSALLLLDPTIFPSEFYGRPAGDASFTGRRRNVWKSPDEMFDRFRNRPPFSLWQPEVLRDYCDFGLLTQGDAYVLACPPAVEASIYAHATVPESNLHTRVRHIRQPVTVMRGGIPWLPGTFDLNASPTDPELAAHFPNGRDRMLDGRTHYIPMESPDLVADEIHAIDRMALRAGNQR